MNDLYEDAVVESLLPTHLLRDIDDNRFFDQHPRYGGTRLQPGATPFRPVRPHKTPLAKTQAFEFWQTRLRGALRPTRPLSSVPTPISGRVMRVDDTPRRASGVRVLRGMCSPRPGLLLPEDLYEEPTVEPARNTVQLCGELMKFVTPSGPRLNGEGTQETSQGITHTLAITDRVILVQMTLLVAGFIIGPAGESVRMIMAKSGADIYSYSECILGRKCRVFYIEGDIENMRGAINVMTKAVVRYKDLAEGKYNGIEVDKRQIIGGIEFFYQPPPKNVVPFAASIRMDCSDGQRRLRPRHSSVDIKSY